MFSIQKWKNWYYGESSMTQKKELVIKEEEIIKE